MSDAGRTKWDQRYDAAEYVMAEGPKARRRLELVRREGRRTSGRRRHRAPLDRDPAARVAVVGPLAAADAHAERARRNRGRSVTRGQAVAMLVGSMAALACLGPSPALAAYTCGGHVDDFDCGGPNPYPCCSNGGNCTWWAWDQACRAWGVALPSWGNARTWASNAAANPAYQVLASPVVNSVAARDSGSVDQGHVAWVTAVNGGIVTVSEMNCGGGYGAQPRTYPASYFNAGFIVRTSATTACETADGALIKAEDAAAVDYLLSGRRWWSSSETAFDALGPARNAGGWLPPGFLASLAVLLPLLPPDLPGLPASLPQPTGPSRFGACWARATAAAGACSSPAPGPDTPSSAWRAPRASRSWAASICRARARLRVSRMRTAVYAAAVTPPTARGRGRGAAVRGLDPAQRRSLHLGHGLAPAPHGRDAVGGADPLPRSRGRAGGADPYGRAAPGTRRRSAGEQVPLEVRRAGERITLTLTMPAVDPRSRVSRTHVSLEPPRSGGEPTWPPRLRR